MPNECRVQLHAVSETSLTSLCRREVAGRWHVLVVEEILYQWKLSKGEEESKNNHNPDSYTHLTLPTILRVYPLLVDVPLPNLLYTQTSDTLLTSIMLAIVWF